MHREDERRSSRPARRAPSTVAREQLRVVDERGPVQRDEPVAARLEAERLPRRVPARAASTMLEQASRSSCCRRGGRTRRSMPSAARLSTALCECASRTELRWSVSRRLCSSGIVGSKLRSPASRWATGIVELRRRERGGERRVDVAGDDDERGRVLDEHLLDADERPRRLLGMASPSRRRGRRPAPAGRAGGGRRRTSRRRSAAPCGRAGARSPGRARGARAAPEPPS